jgi:hypothetical protein
MTFDFSKNLYALYYGKEGVQNITFLLTTKTILPNNIKNILFVLLVIRDFDILLEK